jgi:hypothetical protein
LKSAGTHNWWIFSDHHNAAPVNSANVQKIGNRFGNTDSGKAFLISGSTLKQIFGNNIS